MSASSSAGPSKQSTAHQHQQQNVPTTTGPVAGLPGKLASNPRLPAAVPLPTKKKVAKKESKKQRLRREEGKDKAVERSAMLAERVKDREEKKAKRHRAKKAWE